MNKIITLTTMTLSLLFIGCSSTGVIALSQDSYYIGKKDGAPGLGVSFTNKAEVYKEANEFCMKKDLEVMTLTEKVTPARPAQLGSTELTFKCVIKGGSAKPLQRDSDTIIEVR